MSDLPRLRRHTDGRVAICVVPHSWRVLAARVPSYWVRDSDVSGEGWSELLVAQLPEPHGYIEMDGAPYWAGDDTLPSWVAYPDGVETETGEVIPAEEIRSDALKMLAAAAYERFRTPRDH